MTIELEKAIAYEEGMNASNGCYRSIVLELKAEINRLYKRINASESRVHNQRIEITRLEARLKQERQGIIAPDIVLAQEVRDTE